MKPEQSEKILVKRLEANGTKLAEIRPEEGVGAMLEFYRDVRAEGCEVDQDGDMLLYQWGTYGKTFQLDLTRQFIVEGEDEPYQVGRDISFRAVGGVGGA